MTPLFHSDGHARGAALESLLDGTLPEGEASRVREHLEACPRCAAEMEGWSTLFAELGELPRLAPQEGFADRVVGRLPRHGLLERLRSRIAALAPSGRGHLGPDRLQDLLEGSLAAPAAGEARGHLEGCPACRREAERWSSLLESLDGLPRLAPSAGFAQRVLTGLSEAGAAAPAGVASPWSELVRRARAAVRGWFPDTRRGWAVVTGVAFTPAVALATLAWAVVSHPLVTPGRILTYLEWKSTRALAAAWAGALELALESPLLFRGWELFQAALAVPSTAVTGVLLLGSVMTVSFWTLYRNLVRTPSRDLSHASNDT